MKSYFDIIGLGQNMTEIESWLHKTSLALKLQVIEKVGIDTHQINPLGKLFFYPNRNISNSNYSVMTEGTEAHLHVTWVHHRPCGPLMGKSHARAQELLVPNQGLLVGSKFLLKPLLR